MKLLPILLQVFSFALMTTPLTAQRGVILTSLRLPGLQTPVPPTGTVLVTQKPAALGITLEERSSHVQAGSLRFSVNGSTVSIYTNVNALPHGFLCIVDLTRSGAPTLVAGANTVTVSYLDTWNEAHTDTFRILYAASEDELAGLLFDRTMAAFFHEANAAGAISGLRETLTHNPCLAAAWYNMARMEESLRHWPQASDAFRQYLACSPHGPFSAKARQQLSALAALPEGQPLPPEAIYAAALKQAQYYLLERHFRDALTQAAAAQQLLPQRYEAYAFAASILRLQHQDTDAARLQAMALKRVTTAQRPALAAAFAAQSGK